MSEKDSAEADFSGTSFDSFEDAIKQAVDQNPRSSNHRRLKVVSLELEEGGVVGRLQYSVQLQAVSEH